ncbi:hypothetical protein [Streptomyces sp. B1I3]|uniref:hypothetical protein n=1 Tax=Streptomyces sp. B1I3 TaxID=3042264 RepID=UPI0027805255|nr:hypothetical protein [Streptomyces sp. B1I3]MDQ0797159.1 hypothetical protein [Streptomyces sp. B1I3]
MSDWMPEPGTVREDVADDVAAPPAAPETPSFDPAPPAPIGVARTPTGHAGVDARLERLADADHLPADGHTEVYEDVHRGLRDQLTELDARPAPAPTPAHDNRS